MERRNLLSRVFGSLLMVLAVLTGGVAYAGGCIDESQMPSTTPDDRFDDLADGTIRDKITGLMWKKCVQGMDFNDDCATGTLVEKKWQGALQDGADEAFAGYMDWRLPNKNELFSIVEARCAEPSINWNIFPNADDSKQWTSTQWYGHDNALQAMVVFFRNGTTERTNAGNIHAFRLVRGGR